MAKRKAAKRKQIDVELVRQAAMGRWPEILVSVAGIPADWLDGRHHPCPQCGGKDRFRLLASSTGGCFCNQCFRTKNGDGFAAIQWASGVDFVAAVHAVADYLGIDATAIGGGGQSRKKPPPDKHLSWRPWNDTIVALWCRHKPGVTIDGVRAAGGRLARYRDRYTVVAFPIHGPKLDQADPVGWVICNTTGGPLPKFDSEGNVEWIQKPKTTYGSSPGIIGDIGRLKTAAAAWKLEGVSDLLAWLSMVDTPADHAAVTNANGAGERPPKWVAELFAKKLGFVLHDADRPGQDGALGWDDHGKHRAGWAQEIANQATECRNVRLPYPVAETHGKDFRDWLQDGGTFDRLRELAANGEVIQGVRDEAAEAEDDPYRLARLNLDQYQAKTGRVLRYWNGSWWRWDTGRYRPISEAELLAKMIKAIKAEFDRINIEKIREYRERKEAGQLEEDTGPPTAKKLNMNLCRMVLSATKSLCYIPESVQWNTWMPTKKQKTYITMKNGILDVDAFLAGRDQSEYLLPHSPEWFSQIKLGYDFNLQSQCPKWNAFLERNLELDPERIKLVQEWAGYLLSPDTGQQSFLLFEGEGSNGKSVYCAAIQAMVGTDNCSFVGLELFGDRFAKTLSLGKMVNICGDVGELDKVAEGNIKSYVSGNPMMFDRKGLPGINAEPTAKLMIAANNRPRFTDRSQGIYRRMIPIPWRVEIAKDDPTRVLNMDKAWWWEQSGELSGILNWALVGLRRLRNQRDFTTSQIVDENRNEYKLEMNPARSFLLSHLEKNESTVGIKCRKLYEIYRSWTLAGGHHPLADSQFGREVVRAFPSIKRAKRGPKVCRTWVYVGIDFQEGAIPWEELAGIYIDDF
jgi:P4 family phage/plasmid primase-like protien